MKGVIKVFVLSSLLFVLAGCKRDEAVNNHVEVMFKNLAIPWGMAYLPNGDFIFTQRQGIIDLQKAGAADYNFIMNRAVSETEGGLLGLAVDPDFNSNHYIYIYETYPYNNNQVVRLKLQNDVLTEDKIILTGIPAAENHDGGVIRFGPDGYLYVGTGDALQPDLAQDKNSLAGKILRIDREGNAAPGNPFNNRVWTYGHRNVQGFDWDANGKMIATEHGPTGEFGWCCHDEINLIEPGKNYGWPLAIGGTETDTLTPPIMQSGDERWAPSGCTFVRGSEWGGWENNLIVACLKGERLIRFELNSAGTAITTRNDMLTGQYQRLRNIIQAPDGSMVFSSANIGFAVNPLVGDDKIYKMPVK